MLKILPKTIAGKSLVLNSVLIIVNLIGLTLLLFGYHEAFEEQAFVLRLIGYLVFLAGLIGIAVFQGWLLFAYISRVLVGGLFIVSGLIKANDPKGFSYKLEEYFEDGALAYRVKDLLGWETFSLEFLIEHALWLSIVICIVEIILGVLAIIGAKMRLTAWSMLGMMVFFTLLTWHTSKCDPFTTFRDVDVYAVDSQIGQIKITEAKTNEDVEILEQTATHVRVAEMKKPQCVDDCGCFGDAMKGSVGRSLTPNESFWKDIILTYLVIMLFIARLKMKPNTTKENIIMVSASMLLIVFLSWLFTWNFPILFGLASIFLALWIKRAGGKWLGNDFGAILLITLLCIAFVTYVLMYIPIRDYRPYAVGSDLREKMNDGEDGIYKTQFIYTHIVTNKDTLIDALDASTESIWKDTDNWKWKETVQKTIKAAKLPSITDQFNPKLNFSAMTEVELRLPVVKEFIAMNQVQQVEVIEKSSGNHYPQDLEDFYPEDWDEEHYIIGDTIERLDGSISEMSLLEYILDQPQIILVVSRDVNTGDFSRIQRLKEIHENAVKNNIPMFLISTASKEIIAEFRDKHQWLIPNFINDETEIKAMTRANPTLFILQKGVVAGKYPFRSTPKWESLLKNNVIKL